MYLLKFYINQTYFQRENVCVLLLSMIYDIQKELALWAGSFVLKYIS